VLDVLLALDGGKDGLMRLEVDEPLDGVLAREACSRSLAVLVDAADEIVRDADIERSARAARI